MYILTIIVIFVLFGRIQCQNCTNNEFFDGAICTECGVNSYSSTDFKKCRCEDLYYRRYTESLAYSKPCYRIPSTPLNFTLKMKTATSVSFTWQPPLYNDISLPTRYNVENIHNCRKNNENTRICDRLKWANNIADLSYTKTNLLPYSQYEVDVCSFNEASISNLNSPRDCTDDKVVFRTSKAVPGKIDQDSFKHYLVANNTIQISFGQPEYFGSESIRVHFKCDKINETSIVYTINNISNAHYTFSRPCGVSVMRCTVYTSNEIGNGEEVKTNLFQTNAPSCDKVKPGDSSMSAENIVAIVLVMILLITMVVCGLLFYKWKKRQDKIDERWKRQMLEANQYTDTLALPFRPRNLYVDALEVTREMERLDKSGLIEDDDSEYLISVVDDYDYEFPRENLTIKQRLGEGNFAVVYKAEADNIFNKNGVSTVAVKVLKDTADDKDKADFEEELNLMKAVKPHLNVVKLLGCCTAKGNTAMIVEFLPMGDLLDVLRKSKKTSGPENFGRPYSIFSEEDFISFANDIASGMSHLSSSNIVHRDLACRNVLVGRNRTCKIADLGLARFLDDDGIYKREKEAKLPIKWMSPEALFYGKASVMSDIWAFGITFWEIIAIGASPYPGHKSKDVVSLLRNGYRMPKPSHCSNTLYDIMADCWEESPKNRPNFEDLRNTLQKLLNNDEETYINFEAINDETYLTFDGADDADDDVTAPDILQNETSKLQNQDSDNKTSNQYSIV